jgi:hypothetical protein
MQDVSFVMPFLGKKKRRIAMGLLGTLFSPIDRGKNMECL